MSSFRIAIAAAALLLAAEWPVLSQDISPRDTVFRIEVPDKLILPRNISFTNPAISLLPPDYLMYDAGDYPRTDYGEKFIPDLWLWQRDFLRRNGLYGVRPMGTTLSDPNVMAFLMENKSDANNQLYLINVQMNRQWVGDTQLKRMNVRYREIRHYDFIGLGRLGGTYIKAPEKLDFKNKLINIRTRPRK